MTERRFIVYMHTAPNGKRYLGITYRKPKYRWGVGGKNYSDNEHFWRAIQKYGWDNFIHDILYEDLSKEDACKIEKELIEKYRTNDPMFGYNLSVGGEVSAYGCKRTQEQRQHYSDSKRGIKNPQYGKHSWNYGIPCRAETRHKLSVANKGRKLGKREPLSEEQKQKLRDANLGKIYVNDGKHIIWITKDELPKYLELGYSRGYGSLRNRKKKEK